MISTCPSCGSRDYIGENTCVCGYSDDSFPDKGSDDITTKTIKDKVLKKLARSDRTSNSDEILIKEIDSWSFNYSGKEKCISIGTPALQSFRLRIDLDDLEDLLEQIYQYSGEGKTIRKTQLSPDEMPELIDRVSKKIDEKRARVAVKFNDDELLEITDLINTRLKA